MDIVERMRVRREFFQNGGVWLMGSGMDADCQKAADEIERLRLALRLARQDLKEAIKHINSELGE